MWYVDLQLILHLFINNDDHNGIVTFHLSSFLVWMTINCSALFIWAGMVIRRA